MTRASGRHTMRVLLLNQVFYPDVAATAQHAHDLARHLTAQGHEVVAIASRAEYGKTGAALPAREVVDGITIHRVGRSLFGKSSILARIVDFGLFYLLATIKAFTIRRPDVVICFTTPPFIALVGWLMRVIRGSRFVYWVMDLYPDLPVACGVMQERSAVTGVFERINRFCLHRADRVVVLGRCMRDRVLAKDIDPGHVVHIGVWADDQEVRPIDRVTNPYRQHWNLGDAFTVMYSGNFGLGHDVETMCEAARRLRDEPEIRFLFVGGGKRKAEVDAYIDEHGLTNCVIDDYQPRERLHESLSCADVHLASLKAGVEGIMVPCKLFGIMAAARPTIFIGDSSSEFARVLEEHDAGMVVANGDADALVAAILALRDDPDRCRAMGAAARTALREAYNRDAACEAWRELLETLHDADASEPETSPHGPAAT